MGAVFFLDIDGTLLDEDYRCNDDSLPATIKHLQQAGATFCLNSNRSLEDLLPIAEQFAIEGILIGENGIFTYNVATKERKLLVQPSFEETLRNRKQAFEKSAQAVVNDYYKQSVPWIDADTVAVLQQPNPYPDLKDGEVIALNNSYRKYTTSVHILRKQNGKLEHVPGRELSELTARLRDESHLAGTSNINHSVNFSNILLSPKEVSKKSATEAVLAQLPDVTKVFLIGDEADDYLAIHGLGEFYTVANATDETKQTSAGYSAAAYAKGVHELLHRLSETREPSHV